MGKDVLVLLMVAFGLFAVVMFVLFYVYLKKYYNNKHLSSDYQKDINNRPLEDDLPDEEPVINENTFEKKEVFQNYEDSEMDFVPMRKK